MEDAMRALQASIIAEISKKIDSLAATLENRLDDRLTAVED